MVWHGFTQMATYADNAPLEVVSAEGRELIDVEGVRYLDAISSLWVNTLGHRVPELDGALVQQAGRVAHSTMLGNGNTVVVELAEALRPVVPVDGPHFLFAADGAVAVEQALKIAWQYWANRGEPGRTRFLALGDAYHGDTIGSLSLGDGGCCTAVFDPLRFPVLRTPGYADPGWSAKACAAVAAHAGELAAVVIEPLVQGAAGIHCAEPGDVAALGRACEEAGVLLVCDEVATGFGRTGSLFASEQCGLRPDLLCLGKGITGGYLAMSATVASERVYRGVPGRGPRATHVVPRSLLRRQRPGRRGGAPPPRAAGRVGCAGQRARSGRPARHPPGHAVGAPRRPGRPPARSHGRRRAGTTGPRAALGAPGLRGQRGPPGAAAPAGRRGGDHAAADHHGRRGRAHRRRAGQGPRGGDRSRPRAVGRPVMRSWWEAAVARRLGQVVDEGRWRSPRDFDALGPEGVLTEDGRPVVSFASNDYLGLTAHPDVVAAAHRALDRWGAGSGGSRLVTGSRPVHQALEAALAEWKGTEAAVCFPTGFAANLGVLSVLGTAGTRLCSDELNHASIIDGCRLSRADVSIYRHADPDHLAAVLSGSDAPAVVVTDTVFSMDGDTAPLAELAEVCRRHGALLVLDEAHAVLARIRARGDRGATVLRVGTLSKTLGSLGGFVAGPRAVVDLLVNLARPYIFTTALTPADAAAALAAARRPAGPEGSPCAPGWPATSSAWRRATPRPSFRWCWGPSSGPWPPRPPCWPRGCGCRPSGRRRCPRAPAACG